MVGQEWQMIVHLFKIQKVNLRRKEEVWKKMSAKAALWAECRANMSGDVRAAIRKQKKINSNNNNSASLHILLLLSIIPFHLAQHQNPSLFLFVSGWGLLFQPPLILTLIREEQTVYYWELKQLPYRREHSKHMPGRWSTEKGKNRIASGGKVKCPLVTVVLCLIIPPVDYTETSQSWHTKHWNYSHAGL